MKTRLTTPALALAVLLGMSACEDGTVEDYNPQGTAPTDDVQEGGPEQRGQETPREAAVPEWQERERGEVADGDQ